MKREYLDRVMKPAADLSNANANVQSGTVKMWSHRGFGFIAPTNGGPDIFAHIGQVEDDIDELQRGDRVTFTIRTNPSNGKTEARNVTLIEVGK